MRTIIMTRGLPGSGKSTWAKDYQQGNPNTILVSKDDLRAMLHNGVHSKGREGFVLEIRDSIVIKALEQGHEVIVHDTNFNPAHEARMRQIAEMQPWKGQCEVVIRDFTDVPLETCIQRDLKRHNSVGERVIREMYNKFLRPKAVLVQYNPNLPDCIVCDLDGTLALFGDANPYDRDFLQDTVNEPVRLVLSATAKPGIEVVFLSGRMDKFRDQTETWLRNNWGPCFHLFMRKTNDVRKDFIIKKELYEEHIKEKYNILFILDDRNQVVDMWRSEGLTVFQVAEGNF